MQKHFMGSDGTWLTPADAEGIITGFLDEGLKFLVFGEGAIHHLVLAAAVLDSLKHADVIQQVRSLEATWKLLGAGYVKSRSGARYDSDSCREEWGFDRPTNEDEQRTLLKEICTTLNLQEFRKETATETIVELCFIGWGPWPQATTKDPEKVAYVRGEIEKGKILSFCFIRGLLLFLVGGDRFDEDDAFSALQYCFPHRERPDRSSLQPQFFDLAQKHFVGAGNYGKAWGAIFDSPSCRELFNKDRPSDEEEGERLLELLKQKMAAENILVE